MAQRGRHHSPYSNWRRQLCINSVRVNPGLAELRNLL